MIWDGNPIEFVDSQSNLVCLLESKKWLVMNNHKFELLK